MSSANALAISKTRLPAAKGWAYPTDRQPLRKSSMTFTSAFRLESGKALASNRTTALPLLSTDNFPATFPAFEIVKVAGVEPFNTGSGSPINLEKTPAAFKSPRVSANTRALSSVPSGSFCIASARGAAQRN